jgi:hypothetical protein
MAGIVVEPLKIVYWFIPKNACTAMKIHYANMLGLEFDNVHDAPFQYTNKVLKRYFNFAIVRHPFQRLYSCWANKLAPGHPVDEGFVNDIDPNVFYGMFDLFYSGMPFDKFALLAMSKKTRNDQHWKPQTRLIPEKNIALYRLEDLPLSVFFPVANKDHTGGRWQDFFTDEVKRKAEEYYSEDLIRYGYQK